MPCAEALGFVFYKKSPRYIEPLWALRIIRRLPRRIIKIGVFANAREKTVKHIAKRCHLDILQFHGNESSAYCARFKGFKVIKAFRVKDTIDMRRVSAYKPFAFLLDTFDAKRQGGTGKQFDWSLVAPFGNIEEPVFLSGGLSEKNVKKAIKTVRPDWVDVSSSLELTPGKKDRLKIRKFVRAAKSLR